MERYYVDFNLGYYDVKRGDTVVETRTTYKDASELADRLNEGITLD